jgi:uncharacterized protein YndB with AHSA1/START domain
MTAQDDPRPEAEGRSVTPQDDPRPRATPQDEEGDDARVVRVEVELPGTPEEVWDAIATGPGMECWFVPAEVDGREGGTIKTDHGPFGESTGTVIAWEPPHRFAYEERDWHPDRPDPPPWATEILVEARSGGTCVVRLASGLFSNASGWEDEIDPTEDGWRQGLQNLRLYMTHFRGLRCSSLFALAETEASADSAWEAVAGGLGLARAGAGDPVATAAGAPSVRGVVERVEERGIVLRTDEPSPGLLELFAFDFKGPTLLFVRGYLYGDAGPETVAREEPRWRDWLAETLPGAEANAERPLKAG